MADAAPRLPYQDPQVSVDRRVEDLLERMTIEDKVGLLFHPMSFAGDVDTANDMFHLVPPKQHITERYVRHFSVFASLPDGRQFAQWHNALQRIAAEHPLAIPVTLSTDPRNHFTDNPLASVMAGPFSQWPEPLGLGAIGSEELVREFADIARQEYTAVGLRVALHPQIDLATEPRWARIPSTFGEDADLTARLAVAYIRGFQTDTLGAASVATMTKHFPGGGPQKDGSDPHFPWGREQVYPGGMFDYHLEPFRAAIAAGTSQIMPYYGMPIGTEHEEVGFSYNKSVITGLLREKLGFAGIVCTDWGLVNDKPGGGELGRAKAWGVEHLTEDERLLKLLDAGVDQFGGEYCTGRMLRLVKAGQVTEERIERSARRLLREKFILGLFDNPFVDEDKAAVLLGNAEFRAAGRRAQQRAMTLLTNEASAVGAPTLPLPRGVKIYPEGFGDEVDSAFEGYGAVVDDPSGADVAIVRLTSPWEPSGEGLAANFRQGSIEFSPDEMIRLNNVCAAAPTVIDICIDRPPVLGALVEAAAAIIANYGIEAGLLLQVLFGEVSPEGTLPVDLPSSMAAVLESRSDVPFDTADPAFRFGHGLRYPTPA